MPSRSTSCDVLVVGAGAAGLYVALTAADAGANVCLVSRKALDQTASYWAQGGLAAALAPGDSAEQHAADTITAGRGLCRPAAVRVLTDEAPRAVRDLRRRGVRFDTDPGGHLQLGLEGGHGQRRVVHAGGSATGRRITRTLTALTANHPQITVSEGMSVQGLWSDGERCVGAITDSGPLPARATVLATGGSAALWSRSSNPRGAVGAGVVLAEAAGARLADLEFCQFHPTALALPGRRLDGFLITEAIRGEGATLLGADGQRFTTELAPRDAVTVDVLARMAGDALPYVRLDMTGVDPARFPNVAEALAEASLDPRTETIPVSPAAHYVIGGVQTDLAGRSSLPGLFAVGECAANGLHGANRLASNSLSECFVFGRRAAQAALDEPDPPPGVPVPEWRFPAPTEATRDAVWRFAGPVRHADGLAELLDSDYPLARAIARHALARTESRGGHRRSDHPDADAELDGVHLVSGTGDELLRERW
ncbi:MAG: L-aspartate oxidase [Solirubrobacterales bacterium]